MLPPERTTTASATGPTHASRTPASATAADASIRWPRDVYAYATARRIAASETVAMRTPGRRASRNAAAGARDGGGARGAGGAGTGGGAGGRRGGRRGQRGGPPRQGGPPRGGGPGGAAPAHAPPPARAQPPVQGRSKRVKMLNDR